MVVNVPARQLTVYYNGQVQFQLPVAVGAPNHRTPLGDRQLSQIVWNPSWYPPDAPWARGAKPIPPGPHNPLGPVKMDLGGDIRMHGTNNESSVGHAASHGCMRMKNADAVTLARWIQEHYTQQTDSSLFETYSKKRGQSFFVKLDQAIPLKIVYDLVEQVGDEVSVHPDVYGKMSGDKKSAAVLEYLTHKGFDLAGLYQAEFDRWMEANQKDDVPVSLKNLFPGTLTANESPAPDPFELFWIQSHKISPRKNPQLASLLSWGSL